MLLDHRGNPLESLKVGNGEVVPHVYTFASILNQTSEMYSYRWDEAVRHNPTNALAMRRDCYIRSLIQERAYPTVNREWSIKPEDDKDPVQKATAEHMKKMLLATPHWKKMLEYLVSGGLWYGRYGSQITWGDKNILGVKRRVITKHKPVNGDKLQFTWGDTPAVFINTGKKNDYPDEYIRVTDRNPSLLLAKPQWRQQFIIHTHTIEDADFFEGEMAGTVNGTGLRTLIYWAWWLRDEMLSWCVDFMKKVGTLGLLIFPYEMSNKESKIAAETNAKKASRDIALTMPVYLDKMGSALMPMHVAGNTSGVEALQGMIADYFERHIERMIVGQSMSAGGGGGGGLEGDGRAEFAKDTKFQLLHFDADNVACTLTEDVIKPMQAMNFKDDGFDFELRMEFTVEKPENEQRLQAGNMLVSMGLKVKADELYECAGFTTPEPHDEVVGGIEQLYAQHGMEKYLQPEGGGSTPPADGGFDEDVMQLMADASPELFGMKNGIPRNEIADPGDWKPTKSGRGEYSPSTGQWRPKGSTQNVKQRLTPDIGYRVGLSHHQNMGLLIKKLQTSPDTYRPSMVKSLAAGYMNDSAKHEKKNFVGRFKRLKEQVGENHDQSVFESPEWEAVKEAHRAGLDSVMEHLHGMTEHVHGLADQKKSDPGMVLDKTHLADLDEHRENHEKAHNEAWGNIHAALKAFHAKHGRGKGGAVHLESDDSDFDEYQKKWGGHEHPFGDHSGIGRQAERQAETHKLSPKAVHTLARHYHGTLGMEDNAKGHREAYKTAIGHLKMQFPKHGGPAPIVPELVKDGTKGVPFAAPVKQPGGSGTKDDPFTLDPEPAKPASQPASTFPMQLPQAHPKMPVKPHMPPPPMPGANINVNVQHNPDNISAPKGEATDWTPTKSGRGEYSPSTHKWRPIGEHVQTPGLGKEHHEAAAAKHRDARKANMDATVGMLRGMKGNGRFMDEAKKHPTLNRLMSGQQVGGHEVSKLHEEVGKVKASYGDDGWMLDGMHGLIGDQMKHRENEAESKFHAENWKEPKPAGADGGLRSDHGNIVKRATGREAGKVGPEDDPRDLDENEKLAHQQHPDLFWAMNDSFDTDVGVSHENGKVHSISAEAHGRKVVASPGGDGSAYLDFQYKNRGISGMYDVNKNLQKDSMSFMRKLGAFVGKLKESNIPISYDADDDHQKLYTRALSRAGYELKSTSSSSKPNHNRYEWVPKKSAGAEGNLSATSREPGEDDEFDTDLEPDGTQVEDDDHVSKANDLLKQHADHIHSTHNDEVNEHNQILKDMENLAAKNWIGDPSKNLHPTQLRKKLNAGHIEQASDIPGLDAMATEMARNFPAHFRDRDDDMSVTDQLFDKLKEGKRKRMSRDEAEQKALERIDEMHMSSRGGKKPDDDEEIPFQCLTVVDMYDVACGARL